MTKSWTMWREILEFHFEHYKSISRTKIGVRGFHSQVSLIPILYYYKVQNNLHLLRSFKEMLQGRNQRMLELGWYIHKGSFLIDTKLQGRNEIMLQLGWYIHKGSFLVISLQLLVWIPIMTFTLMHMPLLRQKMHPIGSGSWNV
uniref:Uncharacterized protein n=1 Tax=Lactuca sativa TaxID=4236 RepID=A0A9R1WU27_LACSA|nr:hypothetical protein LSAT_V11C900482320 [Lactuca sativa]